MVRWRRLPRRPRRPEHGTHRPLIRSPGWRWTARPISNLRFWGREVGDLFSRGRWGWAVSDSWDTGHYIAGVLGEMLVSMSRDAHGAPAGHEFADWEADLRSHGEALIAWYRRRDDWGAEEEAAYEKAQKAVRWVADHLGTLWD